MHQHTTRARIRLAANALIAAVVIAAGLVAVQVTTAAPAAAAPGSMSRTQILERARWWVNRQETYSQTGTWAPDPSGKTYRRDCSGLVSMAWGLGTSYTTGSFIGSSSNWTTVTGTNNGADALLPGDAMVWHNFSTGKGHMELFVSWKNPSNHADGAYVYSFNDTGQTVQHPNGTNNVGLLGWNSWDDIRYTFTKYIRRVNATDDSYTPQAPICTYSANSTAKIYSGPGYAYRGESVSQGTKRPAGANTFSNTWTATGTGTSTTITTSSWRRGGLTGGWLNTSQWAKDSTVPCAV